MWEVDVFVDKNIYEVLEYKDKSNLSIIIRCNWLINFSFYSILSNIINKEEEEEKKSFLIYKNKPFTHEKQKFYFFETKNQGFSFSRLRSR